MYTLMYYKWANLVPSGIKILHLQVYLYILTLVYLLRRIKKYTLKLLKYT